MINQVYKEVIAFVSKNKVKHSKIMLNEMNSCLGEELLSRKHSFGHFTTSAVILNKDMDKALVINAIKFNKWLFPGGHIDKGETPLEACIREVKEEVGIDGNDLFLIENNIVDIDIHTIPFSSAKNELEHWHFDLRYLFRFSENVQVVLNDEALEWKWIPIEQLIEKKD